MYKATLLSHNNGVGTTYVGTTYGAFTGRKYPDISSIYRVSNNQRRWIQYIGKMVITDISVI